MSKKPHQTPVKVYIVMWHLGKHIIEKLAALWSEVMLSPHNYITLPSLTSIWSCLNSNNRYIGQEGKGWKKTFSFCCFLLSNVNLLKFNIKDILKKFEINPCVKWYTRNYWLYFSFLQELMKFHLVSRLDLVPDKLNYWVIVVLEQFVKMLRFYAENINTC